jgi:DNA invertase Pin-like site-specific DNA recombinase
VIVDGYCRVSRVGSRQGERFISPEVQTQRVTDYARLHGHQIGSVFQELDESGGRADRPMLLEALARQERGEAQVLCVARLDRLSRSLLDGLEAIQRVLDAGGRFVAVDDGLDLAPGSGGSNVQHQLLLLIAEWQRERVRSNWADAQERAIARGVFMGSVPLGYRRTKATRLVVDPATAPVAKELFARAGRGHGPTALAHWLTDQGIPTATGGVRWSPTSVQGLLRRRAYLGESHHGSAINRAAHEPLVDAASWQAAQDKPAPASRTRRPVLLSGLLRCSACSRVLTPQHDQLGRVLYHCPRTSTKGRCPAPISVQGSVAEPHAEAVLWGMLRAPGSRRQLAAVKRAERQARSCTNQLESYRDNPSLPQTLGAQRFAAGLEVRAQRERAALVRLASARQAAATAAPDLATVQTRWPQMSLDERRELIGSQLAFLIVLPRDRKPRLWAVPAGSEPSDLPSYATRRLDNLGPLLPDEQLSQALPASSALGWSKAKVARALKPFFDERESWPPFAAFQSAGLGLAYANALKHMTCARWAEHFEVGPPPPNRAAAPGWNDQRIRQALTNAFPGWDHWPTREEFSARDLNNLREAVRLHGGLIRWATEMGLPLSRRQRRTRQRWDRDALRDAVAELAVGQNHWPDRKQFLAAGLGGLYAAITRSGIREELAVELGLRLPVVRKYHRPGHWDRPTIDRTLDQFLAARTAYPSLREWTAAELGGLYQTIDRRHEGHNAVAARYGLGRSGNRRLGPGPRVVRPRR